MSRKRQNITLPADLVLDASIFANAKIVYAVLRTFPKNKIKAFEEPLVSPFSSFADSPIAYTTPSVKVRHHEIIERSGLSRHTVVKSLNRLERKGWIIQERSLGSANTYYFTIPSISAVG